MTTEISQSDLDELLSTAYEMSDAARKITLKYFRDGDLEAENKLIQSFDPVTKADRDAELAMREIICRRRPLDGFIGEEHDNIVGTSPYTWVVDPIDGTRGFISGTPTWGTLISVRTKEGPLLGMIDQPYIDERFIGGPNLAEFHRGDIRKPLCVRSSPSLSEATLFTTFPEVGFAVEGQAFEELSSKVKLTRYGMDCYAYALLAAGQIDLVVEAGLSTYDIMAPIAVIEAAGGIATNWKGGKAHDGGRVVCASSPKIHEAALEILSKVPEN